MDAIPEPDPPILAIYQAPQVDLVHRGHGADQWLEVPGDDEPGG